MCNKYENQINNEREVGENQDHSGQLDELGLDELGEDEFALDSIYLDEDQLGGVTGGAGEDDEKKMALYYGIRQPKYGIHVPPRYKYGVMQPKYAVKPPVIKPIPEEEKDKSDEDKSSPQTNKER